jgi:hypothetical protein
MHFIKNVTRPGHQTSECSQNSDSFIESTYRLSLNEAQAQIRNRFELSLLKARLKEIEKIRSKSACLFNRTMNTLRETVDELRCTTGNSFTENNPVKPGSQNPSVIQSIRKQSFSNLSSASDSSIDNEWGDRMNSVQSTLGQYNRSSSHKIDGSQTTEFSDTSDLDESIHAETDFHSPVHNNEPTPAITQNYHERKLSFGDNHLRCIYNKICDARDRIPPRDPQRIKVLKARDPVFAKRYKIYLTAIKSGKAPSFFETQNTNMRSILSKSALDKQRSRANEVHVQNTLRVNPYEKSQKLLNERVKQFLRKLPIY